MPRRRRYVRRRPPRRRRIRYARRKNRRGAASQKVTFVKEPAFADVTRCKLVYLAEYQVTPTALSESIQTFRASSCFDPDLSGTGAQPVGFDEYSIVYGRYRVRACKIEVFPVIDTNGPVRYCISASQDNNPPTFDTLCQNPDTRTSRYISGIQGNPPRLSMYRTSSSVLGIPRVLLTSIPYTATTGANPANNWYYHVVFANSNSSVPSNVVFTCRLTQYVEFYDRNYISQS